VNGPELTQQYVLHCTVTISQLNNYTIAVEPCLAERKYHEVTTMISALWYTVNVEPGC
jgi:hypothetical protein